jgi:hypothetical protein
MNNAFFINSKHAPACFGSAVNHLEGLLQMSTLRPLKQEIKAVTARLLAELRKDFPFFAICGFVVGILMIWQYRLKGIGVARGESWPKQLFADFVSFNAFSLVFLGLIALGAVATTVKATGRHWARLERTVEHLEFRLAQLASSIISFTAGLSILASTQCFSPKNEGYGVLIIALVLFNLLVFAGFVCAALIARRTAPFDRWSVSLLMFCLASVFVAVLVCTGCELRDLARTVKGLW